MRRNRPDLQAEEVERRVRLRMQRQALVTRVTPVIGTA
ncbi:hypothetical protein [Actinomadura sp. NPDC049753]